MKIQFLCAAAFSLSLITGCGSDSDNSPKTHGDRINSTDLASKKIDAEGIDGLWLMVENFKIDEEDVYDEGTYTYNSAGNYKTYAIVTRVSDQMITLERCNDQVVELSLTNGVYLSSDQTNFGQYKMTLVDDNEMTGTTVDEDSYGTQSSNIRMVKIDADTDGFIGTVEYNIDNNGTPDTSDNLDDASKEIICYREGYSYTSDKFTSNTPEYENEDYRYTQSWMNVDLKNGFVFSSTEDSDGDDYIYLHTTITSNFLDETKKSVTSEFQQDTAVINYDAKDAVGVTATIDINRL